MYHPNAEYVVVTMKLRSIFCVVAPSLRRQSIKRDMMLLGASYIVELCKEYVVECSDKWYKHFPKSVEENEEVKLLWDFIIQTDREVFNRRPDIVIREKKAKETIIVSIAVPGDSNVLQKETEKYEKYQDLAREIKRIWKLRTKVVPVVVGALGSVSKKQAGHLEQLGIKDRTRTKQKSTLLGSAHILKKVPQV
ncbi:uncharacterized protein [Montipora capricornis]|uniref:uncharacterized protein n=1 Tax=Montipora capricornis TaxID=246305 RepID=UPI0035F155AA